MTLLEKQVDAVVTTIPGEPTDDFLGAGLRYNETTILRWLMFYKYPEGVPVEEGEKWFLDVHAKEVMKQPGLIRYFSSRTLTMEGPLPTPPPGTRPFYPNPSPLFGAKWHRVSEQWYEDSKGWRKAVIESPPKYTKPKWAKYDKYPFFEPNVDFVSTFILEWPTDDFIKNVTPRYI
jgi:chalcone isomerase